ncbi:hypothetical protein [Lacrimispora sp. HJ-01]
MNKKQVIKVTNSNVKDIDFRKLNNAGENFLKVINKNSKSGGKKDGRAI